MLTIHLFSRTGDLLHTAEIPDPPNDETPDVIAWGARLFVVPDVDHGLAHLEEDLAYVEALLFTLPRWRHPTAAGLS